MICEIGPRRHGRLYALASLIASTVFGATAQAAAFIPPVPKEPTVPEIEAASWPFPLLPAPPAPLRRPQCPRRGQQVTLRQKRREYAASLKEIPGLGRAARRAAAKRLVFA
jgi:hypothetical protein